jgi:hypothetical protein
MAIDANASETQPPECIFNVFARKKLVSTTLLSGNFPEGVS